MYKILFVCLYSVFRYIPFAILFIFILYAVIIQFKKNLLKIVKQATCNFILYFIICCSYFYFLSVVFASYSYILSYYLTEFNFNISLLVRILLNKNGKVRRTKKNVCLNTEKRERENRCEIYRNAFDFSTTFITLMQ